jgi:hypothetical protein
MHSSSFAALGLLVVSTLVAATGCAAPTADDGAGNAASASSIGTNAAATADSIAATFSPNRLQFTVQADLDGEAVEIGRVGEVACSISLTGTLLASYHATTQTSLFLSATPTLRKTSDGLQVWQTAFEVPRTHPQYNVDVAIMCWKPGVAPTAAEITATIKAGGILQYVKLINGQ